MSKQSTMMSDVKELSQNEAYGAVMDESEMDKILTEHQSFQEAREMDSQVAKIRQSHTIQEKLDKRRNLQERQLRSFRKYSTRSPNLPEIPE